ncbi:MAG TPA: hypothetical protein VIG68_07985 [Lysobacter sp.]
MPADERGIVTSHELCAALKHAHPADEYVTLFEVRESTSGTMAARADAIVLSLWSTRGLEITGFEFKVSRGDWLAELKNPAKAERIARYCDRWCVFAAPGVVRVGELPSGWGLWELTGPGTIRRSVVPAAREPEPIPRAFLASLLRARAKLEADDLMALKAQWRREWEKEQRQLGEAAREADPALRRQAEQLHAGLRRLEEIRQATGIDLREFTPSRRWIERMRLADSVALEHKLRLLRDLYADVELRERIDIAMQPDPGPNTGSGPGSGTAMG